MVSRLQKERAAAQAAHRAKVDADFRRRHPQVAAAERGFRKSRAQAERDHGHRHGGTVETNARAAKVRQGSIARMYEAGQLTIDELAAAEQIRAVVERIGLDVGIGTVSLETRVDTSKQLGAAFFERLGAVRAEVAYSAWRRQIEHPALVLAMIVEEVPVSRAARIHRCRTESARQVLRLALEQWQDSLGDACKSIDEADVLAAHAGLI